MTSSALEPEDLENVPLVRMEDVQPSRARVIDIISVDTNCEEIIDTCDIDNYDTEFIVSSDDIGSMVSIKSEEVIEEDDSDAEMIVPDLLDSPLDEIPIEIEKKEVKVNPPDRWPTLEILPGGVIKNADKYDVDLSTIYPKAKQDTAADTGEMMYACAKCSQSFKYLFCLVKHVKWHEEEKKKETGLNMAKLRQHENNRYICLHSVKKKIVISKSTRKRAPKKKMKS